jgi:hypothetical protein
MTKEWFFGFAAEATDFSLLKSNQTDSYIQLASYWTGIVRLFPQWYSGQGINLATLLHLVRSFRMCGTILPLPSHDFLAYIETSLLLLFKYTIASQHILTGINSNHGRKNPRTHGMWDRGLFVGLETFERRKVSCSCWKSKADSWVPQPIA